MTAEQKTELRIIADEIKAHVAKIDDPYSQDPRILGGIERRLRALAEQDAPQEVNILATLGKALTERSLREQNDALAEQVLVLKFRVEEAENKSAIDQRQCDEMTSTAGELAEQVRTLREALDDCFSFLKTMTRHQSGAAVNALHEAEFPRFERLLASWSKQEII